MTTRAQGHLWSILFVAFAVCCAWLTVRLWRCGPLPSPPAGTQVTGESSDAPQPTRRQWAAWLLWPALSCVLLMSVTNHLCQDLAVVPLLWVAPLSLYLLTFIICFDREAWYRRRAFAFAAVLAVFVLSYLPLAGYFERSYAQFGLTLRVAHIAKHVAVEVSVFLVALFLLCMICHGELVRCKPKTGHLTRFYLSVAAGGALGGLLVAVVCPLVLSSYLELNAALLTGFFAALVVLVAELRQAAAMERTEKSKDHRSKKVTGAGDRQISGSMFSLNPFLASSPLLRFSVLLIGWVATAIVIWGQFERWDAERGIARVRNFYGVLSVRERFADDPKHHGLALFHGNTVHGYQLADPTEKKTPTSYYTANSGVGLTLQHFRSDAPVRVGAVGLGAGTIAVYGRPGDLYRFYEINPLVVDMARRYFTFLDDSEATIEIVLGDARLSLERQPPQQYDIFVLDAFSGDSIPVHLLTSEAMQIYVQQIATDGVIAIHISNRYVNLIPVVLELARHFELASVLIRQADVDRFRNSPSDWMLLTNNQAFLQSEAIQAAASHPEPWPGFPLWTDQYNNLLQILHPPVPRPLDDLD